MMRPVVTSKTMPLWMDAEKITSIEKTQKSAPQVSFSSLLADWQALEHHGPPSSLIQRRLSAVPHHWHLMTRDLSTAI